MFKNLMFRSFRTFGQRSFATSTATTTKNNYARKMIFGACASTALVGAGIGYKYETDLGFHRSLRFWLQAGPIYAHYRTVEWLVKNKNDEEQTIAFNKLHDRYADDLLAIILDLKGFYIKIGQIGATRADFVPDQFLEKLRSLEDDVPPMEFSDIRKIIETSFGKKLEEIYAEFEEKPLGAASIGQVHKAVLLDGRVVAVKVQYPNMEPLFRVDIKVIRDFCALAQPEQLPLFDEIEKQFLSEFDYRKEAEHLKQVKINLKEFEDEVVVPEPFFEYCTKEVLTMEFLKGIKLISGIRQQFELMAFEQGRTLAELEEEFKDVMIENQNIQKPKKWQITLYRYYIQTSDVCKNTTLFLYNYTIGWLFGKQIGYYNTPLPMNHVHIIETLLKVHAKTVIEDGYFNGDPHPGNILLLEDGRLGLIDFGQVKQMTLEDRLKLCLLIIALADDNSEAIVRLMKDMGVETENMNPYVIEKSARIFFDRDDMEVTEGMNIQKYVEYLATIDKVTKTADEFIMAGRSIQLLRAPGLAFRYPISVSKSWKSAAEKMLNDHDHCHCPAKQPECECD